MFEDKLINDHDIGIEKDEYPEYLKSMIKQKYSEVLNINTHKGLPCGNDEFIIKLI